MQQFIQSTKPKFLIGGINSRNQKQLFTSCPLQRHFGGKANQPRTEIPNAKINLNEEVKTSSRKPKKATDEETNQANFRKIVNEYTIKRDKRLKGIVDEKDLIDDELKSLPLPSLKDIRSGKETFWNEMPFDLKGTVKFKPLKERELVGQFMRYKFVQNQHLENTFQSLYKQFIHGICNRDYEQLQQILEPRMFRYLKENLDKQRKSLNTLSCEGDIEINCVTEIIDKLFIKGVSSNREENDWNFDYYLMDEHEHIGLRYYFHKYFGGNDSSYFWAVDEDTKMYKHDYDISKFRYKMVNKDQQMILRVIVQIASPGRILAKTEHGEDLMQYDESYTGIHTLILENQLLPPPPASLINLSYEKWLFEHKLQTDKWYISDVDNYMNGNSFFKGMLNIDKYLSTPKKKMEHNIQELMDKGHKIIRDEDQEEPREVIRDRDHYEMEKIAESAQNELRAQGIEIKWPLVNEDEVNI